MKAYKAFDKNLQCRGFQYEVGKTYETDEADICSTGFHACEMPLDVMKYYNDRFCEVELDANEQTDNDTKRVGKKIEIKAELSLAQLIKAQVEYVNEKVEAEQDAAKTDENVETAATSGNWSTAATSGDGSTAATSGNWSTAATSGDGSTAATSGNGSTAATYGEDSVAVAWGYKSKAKGAIGSYIVLSEFSDNGNLLNARMAKVDGKTIKADTFYTLKGGEFVEVVTDDE